MPPALQIVLAIKRVLRPVTFIIVNVSQQASTCTLIFHDIRDFHGLLVTLLDPPKISTNEVNTMGVRAKPTPPNTFLFFNSFKAHTLSGVTFSLESTWELLTSHEIKRCLLLGRKAMTNPDSILKSRNITLPTKIYVVKDLCSQRSI